MFSEVRIYYESIEQANHFILPLVKESLAKNKIQCDVKLIKLKGSYKYYSSLLAPIIFWKDPDVLISIIDSEKEIPLIVLEFSTAVFTEDHELQRFDGLTAAAENNTIYVKISPLSKTSPSDHGGNVNFDFLSSYAAIFKKYKNCFYHFDWPCDEHGSVIVNQTYLSCPQKMDNFGVFLGHVFKIVKEKSLAKNWQETVCNSLASEKFFKEWFSSIKEFKFPDPQQLNSSRTSWLNGTFELKLNRFGHAMDPERGMLAYYGTIMKNFTSKMKFSTATNAWYKDIPKEKEISKIVNTGLNKAKNFLQCFVLGSGLYNNKDFSGIMKSYELDQHERIEIDLTDFLSKNFGNLSKALKTIFKYSDSFGIEDDAGSRRVVFKWKRNFKEEFDKNLPEITAVQSRKNLDEDDVTYITIHNVLRRNDFRILAASYPGAQGDRVILIEPGTGRKQKRKYVDIISYLPDKAVSLEENKGEFSLGKIQEAIDEINNYKTDEAHKSALVEFQRKFEPEAIGKPIRIGVGFWAHQKFNVSHLQKLELKSLDYFIYITKDISSWKIWKTGNLNLFKLNEGSVELPKTFEVEGE